MGTSIINCKIHPVMTQNMKFAHIEDTGRFWKRCHVSACIGDEMDDTRHWNYPVTGTVTRRQQWVELGWAGPITPSPAARSWAASRWGPRGRAACVGSSTSSDRARPERHCGAVTHTHTQRRGGQVSQIHTLITLHWSVNGGTATLFILGPRHGRGSQSRIYDPWRFLD